MNRTDHVRLGAFLLAGLTLIAAATAFLIQRHRARPAVPMITWFDESVTGLAAGSPVRYRGVDIGRVESLAIERGNGAVAVRFQVFLDVIAEVGANHQMLAEHPRGVRLETSDLRVRITANLVTGQAALMVEPLKDAPEPIPQVVPYDRIWIPSAHNSIDALMASLDQTLRRLPSLVERLDGLAGSLDRTLTEAKVGETVAELRTLAAATSAGVERTAKDLHVLLAERGPVNRVLTRLDEVLATTEVAAGMGDARAALADLRLLASDLRAALPRLVQAADQAGSTLRQVQDEPESLIFGPREK